MPRTTPIITGFTGGEISPLMAGRVDLKTYYKSCLVMQNMLPWPHGPATKRPCTYFVAEVKDSAKAVRLIDFEYSTTQAYILEFGHNYMRVYMDGGQVQSGSAAYEIATPYDESDLFELKFVQSADTMYIVHPEYAPRKLTRTGHTAWTLTAITFAWGPFRDQNTTAAHTIAASAVSGSGITLTAAGGHTPYDSDHVGSFWKLTDDEVVETNHSGTGAGSALSCPAGETVYFHLSGTWVGTMTLQRKFAGTWYNYLSFTANTSFELTALEDVDYRWNCTAYTSGTCTSRITRLAVAGYVKITAVASGTSATADVIETLASTAATHRWSEGAWSDYRGYPAAVAFYEQRLVFAGAPYQPDTLWASVVDDYESFETGSDDAKAWIYTLASEKVNTIHWLLRGNVLHGGSAGGEWRLASADSESIISALNPPDVRQPTAHGSANIQAKKIGSSVVFLQRAGTQLDRGRKLRAVSYDFQSDTYKAPVISEKAEHLLLDGIVDMAWTAEPMPVLWMVRSDGWLIGMTYDEENGIFAFHKHDTDDGDDAFESVAAIPGSDRTELWAVVRRIIDGNTVRYIEQFMPIFRESDDLADAFYVDCGYTYDSTPTTTISGLAHLEGETVAVLADGAAHPDRTVASGQISLARSASTVQVGLAVKAKLQPMRLEAGAAAGTAQGKRKKVFKLVVRLHNSLGLKAGQDFTTMDETPFRSGGDPMDSPPPLFTGDKEISMPSGWDTDGYVCLMNDQPLPFTVAAIIPTEATSDY